MMEDRSVIALSSLEFGSAPATDHAWLHGPSESLARLRRRSEATADAGCRVIVITGPAGVGKRRLARWIHQRMQGPLAPMLVVDGAALPPKVATAPGMLIVENAQALEAHGAQTLKERIAQAKDTTLVLLSRLPLTTLRERSMDHEQLFGRMTEAVLEVPDLSERPQDIAAIARVALDETCQRYGMPARALSPGALAELERQSWPGNARQIRGLLEQAALGSTGRWISPADLGLASDEVQASGTLHVRLPGASLREIEIKAITLALELADGRIVRAAELLGITRHALRRKIDKFGVNARPAPAPDPDASI